MKQTTFFQTLIGLSALLLLSACEKDEEITTNLPQGFPAGCLLEKRSGDGFEYEYEFDDDGLLLTKPPAYASIDTFLITVEGRRTYQRDAQGRVIRANEVNSDGKLLSYYEYEYEGSNEIPSRRNNYDVENNGSEDLKNYAVYESEENKVLSIRSFSAAGELVETITYAYDDEAAQYTIRRYHEDMALYRKEVYTYNPQLINPYYSVWASRNNFYNNVSVLDFPSYTNTYACKKKEEFDASGTIIVGRSYSVTYDIDENGRIINLKRIYLDGDTYNESLIYDCG